MAPLFLAPVEGLGGGAFGPQAPAPQKKIPLQPPPQLKHLNEVIP